MTFFTEIPNAEIEPEKPGTSALFSALRDNPIAISEGSNGAPKIQTAAYQDRSVTPEKLSLYDNTNWTDGTLLTLFALNGPISSSSAPPSKTSIYYISQGKGAIRFSFQLRSTVFGRGVFADIYKNGALYTSISESSGTFQEKTGTINVNFGDEIHLRLGEDGGLSSDAVLQNFLLSCNY